MLEFLNPKICGFGIDLSDLSIKIANLKKSGDEFALSSFSRQEIPEGAIDQGEIKKEEVLISVIKEAVKNIKGEPLKTKYCIVSLPETVSFVQMVKMPSMTPEELTEAIKWELEAHIPLSREEIYYDWQIIEHLPTESAGQPVDHLDVLIGVLPKKTVDPYLEVLKKAGLKPFIFEIESVATARALIKNGVAPAPLMIVDFGAKRTGLLIFSGRTIFFTTSLPISNVSLVDSLSKKLNISREKARQIKFKVGLDLGRRESDVFETFQPSMNELVEKIQSYIDFYQEHVDSGNEISRILLCGGGANLAGLPEFLAANLKMPVEIGNPWVNIFEEPKEIPGLPPSEALAYTTALGLALRGVS
jgi:type IV pilus assembly protein PilM